MRWNLVIDVYLDVYLTYMLVHVWYSSNPRPTAVVVQQ